MSIFSGIIGGCIGGAIGAAIWAGVSAGTGYEIGWIAWGVGGLVGFGVARGCKTGSPLAGTVAVVLTIGAILVGKYVAVDLAMKQEVGSEDQVIQQAVDRLQNDEFVVTYLCDDIVAERESAGQPVNWPPGVNPQEASQSSDYPADIWAEGAAQWDALSDQEKADLRNRLAAFVRQNVQAAYAEISGSAFRESFGMMDALFFVLAVGTAYKLGLRGSTAATGAPSSA